MTIQMSDDVAAQVEDRFDNLAQDFVHIGEQVEAGVPQISAACGEFAADMESYTGNFATGWTTTLEIASTSAGLIAGNTNQLKVDLDKVDVDASHQTDITI